MLPLMRPLEKKYKPCKYCGQLMECVSDKKTTCFDCKIEYHKKWYIKRSGKPKKLKQKLNKVYKPVMEKIKCLVCGTKFVGNGRRSYCDKCRVLPRNELNKII